MLKSELERQMFLRKPNSNDNFIQTLTLIEGGNVKEFYTRINTIEP